MHPTPNRGPSPAPFDFPVRFGDEPTVGGPPLRQRWKAQGAEGEIRALDERGLRERRHAIAQVHGARVQFGEPRVHTYLDPLGRTPLEPLMAVKVTAPREHLEVLLRELRKRAVRMHDVEIEWHRVVLRCEARLAALLGFEAVAEAQGARPVRVSCRLLRYEASPGKV